MEELTLEYLHDIRLNQSLISFIERNNLLGMPLSVLHNISGDYFGLFQKIKYFASCSMEKTKYETIFVSRSGLKTSFLYDENGRIKKETHPSKEWGEYLYLADNIVKINYSSGAYEEHCLDDGRITIMCFGDDFIYGQSYYDDTWLLKNRDYYDGSSIFYERNSIGNLIYERHSKGFSQEYEYTHVVNINSKNSPGQLVAVRMNGVEHLEIPYFQS